jgi:integrase
MGTLFKKQVTRSLPSTAEIVVKSGKRFARWQSRGKTFTAPVTGPEDAPRITTTSKAYSARYRSHDGRMIERPTRCRDRQAAEQMLGRWEREQEQIAAGILDPKQLETARSSHGSLETHLDAYEANLIARALSTVYKANALRAIRRLAHDLGLTTVKDLRREKIEPWFAHAISEGMGARSRNYYRNAVVIFANWLQNTDRIQAHDLDRLPKADERIDPRRRRRALTEGELGRLLAVARTRPLEEAKTIRRGERKGHLEAVLRPEVVKQLDDLGRERVLIYRTLVLTGLRLNELRTLTVAQLDLTQGAELVRLEAKHEKNRAGSSVPLRGDLAQELRQWITERRLGPTSLLFAVPAGLRRILDRDLHAAGIPKRDERGRTIDVHAIRTTFGTLLSKTGTAPRTAQAAMRHSDIKLTMGTYTDPKLLDVREAMERLPSLTPNDIQAKTHVALHVALLSGSEGQNVAITGNVERESNCETVNGKRAKTPGNVNEKAPVTSVDITGAEWRWGGLNPRPLECHSNGIPSETPEKQGDSETQPLALHATLHTISGSPPETPTSNPASPLPLAELLKQLAALPPERRQALAALLGSPAPTAQPTTTTTKPTLDW